MCGLKGGFHLFDPVSLSPLLVQCHPPINNVLLLTVTLHNTQKPTMEKNETGETVDELRQRLNNMKKLMAERQSAAMQEENRSNGRPGNIIDGSFLSVVFGVALFVIVTVSIYAFYNLYHAILKKFPSHHTEL